MISMDLISHDISLYRYPLTDVIEIHLLLPWVRFHSITGTSGEIRDIGKIIVKREKLQ